MPYCRFRIIFDKETRDRPRLFPEIHKGGMRNFIHAFRPLLSSRLREGGRVSLVLYENAHQEIIRA